MDNITQEINDMIAFGKDFGWSAKQISDGYHTFEELYEFRMMYNAVLFNEWAERYWWEQAAVARPTTVKTKGAKYNVHKSWKHHDGEYCFGGEKKWFIVSAMLPSGLISNHYKAEHWDLFNIPEVEKALYPFDGHTGADVLQRLKDLT